MLQILFLSSQHGSCRYPCFICHPDICELHDDVGWLAHIGHASCDARNVAVAVFVLFYYPDLILKKSRLYVYGVASGGSWWWDSEIRAIFQLIAMCLLCRKIIFRLNIRMYMFLPAVSWDILLWACEYFWCFVDLFLHLGLPKISKVWKMRVQNEKHDRNPWYKRLSSMLLNEIVHMSRLNIAAHAGNWIRSAKLHPSGHTTQ